MDKKITFIVDTETIELNIESSKKHIYSIKSTEVDKIDEEFLPYLRDKIKNFILSEESVLFLTHPIEITNFDVEGGAKYMFTIDPISEGDWYLDDESIEAWQKEITTFVTDNSITMLLSPIPITVTKL